MRCRLRPSRSQDGLGGGGAGHDDGLLVEVGHDGLDQAGAGAGRDLDGGGGELAATGLAQPGRSAVAGQQFQRGFAVEFGADGAFQSWVDVREQATDAIEQPGRFMSEVVVVANEDLCRTKLSIKVVELLFRVDWSGCSTVFVDGATEDTTLRACSVVQPARVRIAWRRADPARSEDAADGASADR
ncbi:MAG: hypothetical protein QOE61_2290 [Micromonosporaceae bacterium]|nr:hypothetical protein [Micromonosporaceae bacterium]